jgi:hypothetical protein
MAGISVSSDCKQLEESPMVDDRKRKPTSRAGQDTEAAWKEFLQSEFAKRATAKQLARVRTRVPLEHRAPSVALYQGLLLHVRGQLALHELEGAVDLNEKLDRAIRAERVRSTFKVVSE